MHSIETSRRGSKVTADDVAQTQGTSRVLIDECHACKCPSCLEQARTHFVARFEGATLNTYSSTSCAHCGYWDGRDVYASCADRAQSPTSESSWNEPLACQAHRQPPDGPARPACDPTDVDVTINGTRLTGPQAMVLRVAVHYFVGDLSAANLACGWHDRETMRDSLQRAAEIIDMISGQRPRSD